MARQAKENFKGKTAAELAKLALDFREKLWQSKIDLMSGKVKNIKEIRAMKKDIARILTAQKALASAKK